MYQRGFRGSPLTRGTCITKCVSGKFPSEFEQGGKRGVSVIRIRRWLQVETVDVLKKVLEEIALMGRNGYFTKLRVDKKKRHHQGLRRK